MEYKRSRIAVRTWSASALCGAATILCGSRENVAKYIGVDPSFISAVLRGDKSLGEDNRTLAYTLVKWKAGMTLTRDDLNSLNTLNDNYATRSKEGETDDVDAPDDDEEPRLDPAEAPQPSVASLDEPTFAGKVSERLAKLHDSRSSEAEDATTEVRLETIVPKADHAFGFGTALSKARAGERIYVSAGSCSHIMASGIDLEIGMVVRGRVVEPSEGPGPNGSRSARLIHVHAVRRPGDDVENWINIKA